MQKAAGGALCVGAFSGGTAAPGTSSGARAFAIANSNSLRPTHHHHHQDSRWQHGDNATTGTAHATTMTSGASIAQRAPIASNHGSKTAIRFLLHPQVDSESDDEVQEEQLYKSDQEQADRDAWRETGWPMFRATRHAGESRSRSSFRPEHRHGAHSASRSLGSRENRNSMSFAEMMNQAQTMDSDETESQEAEEEIDADEQELQEDEEEEFDEDRDEEEENDQQTTRYNSQARMPQLHHRGSPLSNGSSSSQQDKQASRVQKDPNHLRAPQEQPTVSNSTTRAISDSRKNPRRRKICNINDCPNKAIDHGVCGKHGGGKRCMIEDCGSRVQRYGLCWKHGGYSFCAHEGCRNRVKARGLCVQHGAQPPCSVESCTNKSVSSGLCRAHGGGRRCGIPGCRRLVHKDKLDRCKDHW